MRRASAPEIVIDPTLGVSAGPPTPVTLRDDPHSGAGGAQSQRRPLAAETMIPPVVSSPPLGWWVIASAVPASRAVPLTREVLRGLRPRFSLLSPFAGRLRSVRRSG